MKVAALIDYLKKLNPEAEVIIHRDNYNYGFGMIDTITPGIFEENDWGNDFLPYQALVINPKEVKAVCLYPEDYEPLEPKAVDDH